MKATYATLTKEQHINGILSVDATPLRRTLCQKYYERSEVELWRLGKREIWAVWQIDGFYYGVECVNLNYDDACKVREILLENLLDEKGIVF